MHIVATILLLIAGIICLVVASTQHMAGQRMYLFKNNRILRQLRMARMTALIGALLILAAWMIFYKH
ncbi:hypothetical protein QS257_06870 [Terrilactibacillus sp. S3-3]|nr:hypothetical protein QS257_06870 [Terrilactibacillus sp. S3-3]